MISEKSILDKIINLKDVLLVSLFAVAVLFTCDFFLYQMGSLISNILSMLLVACLTMIITPLWVMVIQNKKGKGPLKLRDYMLFMESRLKEINKGMLFIRVQGKPFRKVIVITITTYSILWLFSNDVLTSFSDMLSQDQMFMYYSLSKAVQQISIHVLILLGVLVLFKGTLKYLRNKELYFEVKKILVGIGMISEIEVRFVHKDGKRILNTDYLLDQLVKINDPMAKELYIRLKTIYSELQGLEFIPEGFEESLISLSLKNSSTLEQRSNHVLTTGSVK